MNIRIALIVFLAFFTLNSDAQFWKKKKKKAETESRAPQPNSLNPSYQEKGYSARDSRKARRPSRKKREKAAKGPTYGLIQEYYERMEDLAKKRRKIERMMKKPQYSNPLYFGHKRKPKKHKPSKMKFCKECGIRH